MSYMIAMGFISYSIAFAMMLGFTFIRHCEKSVNDEDSDEETSMGSEMILNRFNSHTVMGKMALIFIYGVTLLSIPFVMKGRKK